MRIELMTLEALKRDPWIAVVMPLPASPDLRLLAVARHAARLCVREAQSAPPASAPDPCDDLAFLGALAAERIAEINRSAAEIRRHLGNEQHPQRHDQSSLPSSRPFPAPPVR